MTIAVRFLAVVALCGTGAAATAASERPNVVWVFVEDMNGWMGCYGDDTVPTPHVDRLAKEGIRFDRAYMPAGVCSPCRSAIATGAMQTSLGIHNHRSSRRRTPGEVVRLPEGVRTVYELMREAGYYVYSNPGKNDFNFVHDRGAMYDKVVKRHMGYSGPAWRKRPDGKPFFAQIQLQGGKNSGKFRADAPPTDPSEVTPPPYYPDIDIIREEIAHHYDCVRQTDEELGDILAGLEQDGLLENTVVFFWTDHGMRLYRHKQWLYEGGIRVPLVVRGPGLKPGEARADLVSGIDITVTTLGVAGVARPEWMEGRDLFADDFEPRDHVVSARDRCDYTIDRVRAVTTERYKYLRNYLTDRPFMQPQYRDGRPYIEDVRALHESGGLDAVQEIWWSDERPAEELYDLEADPHEIHNLAGDPESQEALGQCRAILEAWIAETGDKGQAPESLDSLRGAFKQWRKKAVNPEYDALRKHAKD